MTKRIDPLQAEFVRLLDKSGWSQSEAARQLELSPAAVSQYISLDTVPSKTTIKLFKCILADEEPVPGLPEFTFELRETVSGLDDWEQAILTDLRALNDDDRKRAVHHFRELASMMTARKVSYRKNEPGATRKTRKAANDLMKAAEGHVDSQQEPRGRGAGSSKPPSNRPPQDI